MEERERELVEVHKEFGRKNRVVGEGEIGKIEKKREEEKSKEIREYVGVKERGLVKKME